MRYLHTISIAVAIIFTSLTVALSQNSPEQLSKIRECNAPVNVGQQLLKGVVEGKLKLLKFDEFGGNANEISIGSIRIFEEDSDGIEWEESELYYEGDLIYFEGSQYESTEDNNQGNRPDQSENWQEYVEAWYFIDEINSFFYEKSETSKQEYFHLYHQNLNDEFGIPRYLASFEASGATKYLNDLGLLWYQMDQGHLAGSIFLDIPNNIFLKSAKISGINITSGDISFEDRMDKWWSTSRNLVLGDSDSFRFIYYDDSVMWEMPAVDYNKLGVNSTTDFILLGDAMYSGKAFDEELAVDDSDKVKKIETFIVERFPALDQLYVVKNSKKELMPVGISDISLVEWITFVEAMIDGAKSGKWTPYSTEKLDNKMSLTDLDLKMMINEDEAIDLSVENDPWKKTVVYYIGDVIDYAGILYESVKENNEDHIPSQWPEYWREVVLKNDYFYPDELQILNIGSEFVFTNTGRIESVKPVSFSLEIPGNFVPSGFNKEIAWFDLNEINNVDDESVNKVIDKIKSHDFYAELLRYEPLRAGN